MKWRRRKPAYLKWRNGKGEMAAEAKWRNEMAACSQRKAYRRRHLAENKMAAAGSWREKQRNINNGENRQPQLLLHALPHISAARLRIAQTGAYAP
jgi:hypothetical protein